MRHKKQIWLLSMCSAAFMPMASLAADSAANDVTAINNGDNIDANKLLNLSLAELSNVEITSVSKKAEKESEAAAAIFVVTQEDIRRSGATNLPDALRMVPGLDVTQAGGHDWTVASRGFDNQFSNQLLVLIDGRTVYSPLFSGVFWSLQDVMLQDIDRIEVIRGPGATLWGANAVNGVINIITKSAKDTQGGLAEATVGNQLKGEGAVRQGVKLGDGSYIRTFVKYDDYAAEYTPGGHSAGDGSQMRHAGFRSDSKLTDIDSLTLQGDIYDTHESVNYAFPNVTAPYFSTSNGTDASGGNVLSRWTRDINPESSITTQFYVDNTQYKTGWGSYNATTTDFDFQHTWTGWERNEIIWGAGYRLVTDHNSPTAQFSLSPTESNDGLYSAFLQDKIALLPKSVFLTLGSKFEHNVFTGDEIQPSARLAWLVTDDQTVWGSISHAVHTANRYYNQGNLSLEVLPPTMPLPVPLLVAHAGNPNLDSEELTAYELGYRIQPTKSSSIDIASFYNDYSKLFVDSPGTPVFMGTYVYQPVTAYNAQDAHSTGIEVSGKWNATDKWQLSASYTYLDLIFDNKNPGISSTNQGMQPKSQFNIRSTYILPYQVEMTNSLYYVESLPTYDIPGYYRFDTKLSREIMQNVELSLVGQNLLEPQHKEFIPFLYQSSTEVGRSVYANLTVKF